jgi:hypothetical protein
MHQTGFLGKINWKFALFSLFPGFYVKSFVLRYADSNARKHFQYLLVFAVGKQFVLCGELTANPMRL